MGVPEECTSADNNGTWWCKIIKDDDNSKYIAKYFFPILKLKPAFILVEKNMVVGKIVINCVLFILCVIGFIGVSYGNSIKLKPESLTFFIDKPKMILPFIIYEFLLLLLWVAVEVMVVLVLAVYLTTSVDITTTVSVAVIAAIWTVMMFYLWLCVVSHYQVSSTILKRLVEIIVSALMASLATNNDILDPGRGSKHGI